jgi:uncharacterized protein (DUF427 family)
MSDLARWEIKAPPARVEPTPRWARVRIGTTLVADSRRARLLVWYGPGRLPTYCFPPDDVRAAHFVPSTAGAAPAPFLEVHDVRDGDTVVPASAFRFADAPAPLDALDGSWTFAWDTGLSWFEEALEVHVHAREPRHRVDAVPSERHVRVEVDGVVVAESRRPHALFETTLPTRWYFPLEDVREELLVPTATVTRCPYKGTAAYFSVRVGDTVHEDLAWTYRDPVIENPRIAHLVAFFNERVDLVIDGEPQARPVTPWSKRT